MVDAFTDVGSGASLGLNLVKTGYDKALDFELRSQPLYRQAVTLRKINELTNPGETVVFNLYNYLDPLSNSDLSETDPASARAVPSTSTVSVTIREFGDVVIPTWRLRTYSFADVDQAIAQIVAATAADDVDNRVRAVAIAGTNVLRSDVGAPSTTQTQGALDNTDVFSSKLVRSVVAKMRGASAPPVKGNLYAAYVHPDQSLDLQAESGAAGWRAPHEYSAPGNIWAGEIGSYQGAFFVESPRVFKDDLGADKDGAGAGTALWNVYHALFMGAQALCEAVSEEVNVTIGPITDPHNRHRPLGYHGAMGWSRYREDSLWRVETGSSNDI